MVTTSTLARAHHGERRLLRAPAAAQWRVARGRGRCARPDGRKGRVCAGGCRANGRGRGRLVSAFHLVAGHEQLFQVAGRLSDPRRDRATASVSAPQSRPTVSTTMSGMLPVLSP
jgi:hypothetical protein